MDPARKEAKLKFYDVLLVDTAGRLHVDEAMMDEIKQVHASINPVETLFVVDAMTGQDAANTAKAFNEALPLTGVVLTKVDGDARGGAALSIRHITGKPIKFLGVGEKTEALEPFHPDRIASRILGMGDVLSLIEATIAAPALVQMNVPVLAAHMFAFYFGIVADVTPPVALAAYAGAGIAGANPMRTGVIAAKLAIAAFIVPYIFVLAPELLMINATPFTICYSAFTAIVGMWGASMAMIGFCNNLLNIPQRILFLVGGICMIIPGVFTDGIGVALVAVAYVWQRMNKVKGAIQQDGEDL